MGGEVEEGIKSVGMREEVGDGWRVGERVKMIV